MLDVSCVFGFGDMLLFWKSERSLNHISTHSSFYTHMWEGGERGIYVCNFFPSSWNKNNLGAGHQDENCLLEGECVRI